MARYPKGSTNNVVKEKTSSRFKKGEIIATASNIPTIPDKPSDLFPSDLNSKAYIPNGSDNLFPQAIAQLTRNSPSHRGILKWKTIYCTSKGLYSEDKNVEAWIKKANNKRENLKKIAKKYFFDKLSAGNSYIEIVTNRQKSILNLYHKDHTMCRISKDGTSVLIYPDMQNIDTAPKDKIKSIPLFPVFAEDENSLLRSIYHVKDYEPEFMNYGVPSWLAAMDAAAIAYKTNKWNVSRLDNDFTPSGTLVIEGDITAAQAKKMKKEFLAQYTGEGKQGKVFFVVKQLGGGKTEFIETAKTKDGEWLQLHKQANEDLIIAHTWFPSLCGVSEPGKLGNVQQIRTEYQVALSTVIAEEQEDFLNVLKEIIAATTKWKTDTLAFNNEFPVSLRDLLDPKDILTRDEQREVFGYLPTTQSTGIINGDQSRSITEMLAKVSIGEIPRDTGVQFLIHFYNKSKEIAEQIIGSAGKKLPKTTANG